MEWIKCSERMPEPHELVLFFYPKDKDKAWYLGAWNITSGSWDGDEWFCDCSMECHIEEIVTHWMPLPELPKDYV